MMYRDVFPGMIVATILVEEVVASHAIVVSDPETWTGISVV